MKRTEADFETIYHATYPVLSRFLFRKTRRFEDAQDLLQEIYFAFYRHYLNEESTIENPQAYLLRMAEHELGRYYQAKAQINIVDIDSEDNPIEMFADDVDLDTEVLNHLSTEMIWQEIQRMDEPVLSILVARFRFDLDYPEIAELFAMPVTTIKSKVYKAISQLKQKFNK